jgi:hypothetical protein
MKHSTITAWIVAVAVACGAFTTPAFATDKKDCNKQQEGPAQPAEGGGAPVGYGGSKVQMLPIMTPYHSDTGIRYEPLTLRLALDPGPMERSACFSVPYVHDHMLSYLYAAHLTSDDLSGEKRDVLAKNLLQVAIDTVGAGYYTNVEIVGPDAEPLDCKSQTLSSQCK